MFYQVSFSNFQLNLKRNTRFLCFDLNLLWDQSWKKITPSCQAIRCKAKTYIVLVTLVFPYFRLFFHLDISLIIDAGILCLISNWFLWFLFCSSPQKTTLMCPVKPIYFDLFTYLLIPFFSTETDILALATRVQKSLKEDGSSAGIIAKLVAISLVLPLAI